LFHRNPANRSGYSHTNWLKAIFTLMDNQAFKSKLTFGGHEEIRLLVLQPDLCGLAGQRCLSGGAIAASPQHLSGVYILADTVQDYLSLRPVVARGHSNQMGTARYFRGVYVGAHSWDGLTLGQHPPDTVGTVLLCQPGPGMRSNSPSG
jgi:hypothetical protein